MFFSMERTPSVLAGIPTVLLEMKCRTHGVNLVPCRPVFWAIYNAQSWFLAHNNVLFLNATDLEKKLNEFKNYYNEYRFHQSLQETPDGMANKISKKVTSLKNYHWKNHVQGLFQTPCAA